MNLLLKLHMLHCSTAFLLVSQILTTEKQNTFNSLNINSLRIILQNSGPFTKESPRKIQQHFIPFQSMVYVSYITHTQRLINCNNKMGFPPPQVAYAS